jgi:hypothetical protein
MIVVKGGSFSFSFYGVNEVRESSIHPSFPRSIHSMKFDEIWWKIW